MFFVYVLRSDKDNHRYIGFSDNVERRLSEHHAGQVDATRHRRPLKLIYTEEFATKHEAMKREKFFKSHKGRDFLDSIGK
ncbi:MAG: GIY-YIG nuclease family protein [bacterium]